MCRIRSAVKSGSRQTLRKVVTGGYTKEGEDLNLVERGVWRQMRYTMVTLKNIQQNLMKDEGRLGEKNNWDFQFEQLEC